MHKKAISAYSKKKSKIHISPEFSFTNRQHSVYIHMTMNNYRLRKTKKIPQNKNKKHCLLMNETVLSHISN